MKVAGEITISSPDRDRPFEQIPTYQCVHCGGHWEGRPGSGRTRGWCMQCNGPVCGPVCSTCVPYALQLENLESGLPPNTPRSVSVQSPGGIWLK